MSRRVPKQPSAIDQRVADQAWAFYTGRHAEVVDWLVRLGCKLIECHETSGSVQYTLDGLVGVRSALLYPSGDPISGAAVPIGFLLAGMFWPQAYPGLLPLVNQRWSAQMKEVRSHAGSYRSAAAAD
jgi:hypothetical protein